MEPTDNHRVTPIMLPKHYKCIDVITPMLFTNGQPSTAYYSLTSDLDEMIVSDLDYLEEPDIMNWYYLKMVIRKNSL